jgi:hypothetical protein
MARLVPCLVLALACAFSAGAAMASVSAAPPAAVLTGTSSLRQLLRARAMAKPADTARVLRSAAVLDPPLFSDVTTPALADTAASFGVSWGDYDRDGDADLCVSNEYVSSHLFRNDSGLLVDDTVPTVAALAGADGMTWGDYDNDGDSDLYVSQYGQPNHLLRNDGHDVYTDVTGGALGDPGPTTAAIWGDYDRDGRLDLYLAQFTGGNKLLHNLGGGTFADATSGPLAGLGASMSAAWGDYDGDGDLDLYVANFNKPNQLFRNDGGGAFTDVTTGPLGDPGYGTGVVWGDLDNDGDLDLFVVNDGGSSRLLRNDGASGFTDATSAELAAPGPGIGVTCGDIDNDGDLDLFVTRYGEADQLFRNDGAGGFEDATSGVLADPSFSTGTALGDYDKDGDLDLFVANDGNANHLYRNDLAPGNHWLQVRLHGTQSNGSGIGARVKLVAGGVTRMRELSGGSGFGSQDALVAAFGLGATATFDTLIVEWPSGIRQWLIPASGADRVIDVTESVMALGVGDGPARGALVHLAPAAPNPFRARTRIDYELPRSSRVDLSVLDAQGRRVMTLDEGAEPAGRHSASWDGHDATGHEVHAGFYVVRLTTASDHGDETRTVKLLLTR